MGPIIGRGSENKHLPSFWFGSPREFRQGLLEGLIDTDGSISVNNSRSKPQLLCSLHTTSVKLSHEIQMLLRSLDLDSRISPYTAPSGKPAFNIVISTKKLKEVGLKLAHPVKQKHLEEVPVQPETSKGGRHYTIPMSLDMACELRKLFSHKEAATKKIYTALSDNIRHGRTSISRNKAKDISKYLKEDPDRITADAAAWLNLVDNSDTVIWDKVVSYETTGHTEQGWDLTVPGFETFMSSDGVILSNTASFTVPVSKEAVEQSINKLMPEKSLLSERSDKPHYTPSNEYVQGLYFATKSPSKKGVIKFKTKKEAIDAYRRGEIRIDDPIDILEK